MPPKLPDGEETQVVREDGQEGVATAAEEKSSRNKKLERAWAPIVLSLDGGGVRGLSTLYILKFMMEEIRRLEKDDEEKLEDPADNKLPLPCNYFDFIIGTSTGGLIAIMLGRLRMGVNECIQQYWILSNRIFVPPRIRFLQLYSRRDLLNAARNVVSAFCNCHGNERCNGLEELAQYDFEEDADGGLEERRNTTCKVAVMTVREQGLTSFKQAGSDVPILFKSYNHRPRLVKGHSLRGWNRELNPKNLHTSTLTIAEACACTAAAPTYFWSVLQRGRRYADGGLWANNPALVAWREAEQMANPPIASDRRGEWKPVIHPRVFVSIGTGQKPAVSKFGKFSVPALLKAGIKDMTDTEKADKDVRELVSRCPEKEPCTYVRLNVPSEMEHPEPYKKGLDKIRLDECKKVLVRHHKMRGRLQRNGKANGKERSSESTEGDMDTHASDEQGPAEGNATVSSSEDAETQTKAMLSRKIADAAEADKLLREEAKRNWGFEEGKYVYRTFDNIRDRTTAYLHSDCRIHDEKRTKTRCMIRQCAVQLRTQHLERKDLSEERWRQFRRHPNPEHSTRRGGH